MGFTVNDSIALLDRGLPDGLCQMTLAGAGWTENKAFFVSGDEGGSIEVEDEATIHLLVVKVKSKLSSVV